MKIILLLLFSVFLLFSGISLARIIPGAATDPLASFTIAEPIGHIPYKRKNYAYGIDADRDGQNTRAELLIKRSTIPVTFKDKKQRTVTKGKWFDPYTGVTFKNANAVDIDHLVPLYEAHISGAALWSDEKKRAFANDLDDHGPLRIIHRWTNRIPKSADDPSEYTPSYVPGRCAFLNAWLDIKQKWQLTIDPAEATAIRAQLRACV